jgi:hypothetical protein
VRPAPPDVFREIRGVAQPRNDGGRKRWFQDSWFDLFVVQNAAGRLQWFQLCYRRDTPFERVLEWRRNRGFMHLRPRDVEHSRSPESTVLVLDGLMPYEDVATNFRRAAGGLPPDMASFIATKVDEYAHPQRRFRRPGARTPRWLERLRRQGL